jgi:plastocyanin
MPTTVERRNVPHTAYALRLLHFFVRRLAATAVALVVVPAYGGDVAVTVRAPNGALVPAVTVVLDALTPAAAGRRHDKTIARMEQRDRRFIPQLLVIQAGTLVEFPNNDTVSHQVYSFSAAHRFQLSLYKGSVHPPIAFDRAGLVVLGCNIHDDMIGYILVTESPFFTQTDARGVGRVSGVAPGQYTLRLWAPRIADPPASLDRRIEVGDSGEIDVSIVLAKALLAAPTPRPGRTEWDAY